MAKKPFEAGGIAETNTFVDATDTTKKLAIDVGGTTGVTGTLATAFTTAKTITFPDTAGTVALTSDAPTASPTVEGKLYGYSNSTNLSRTTLGYQAGNVASASNTTIIGYQAGSSISTGDGNTVVGSSAARSISTGTSNTVFGHYAMASSNGSSNTVIGNSAGTGIGSNNTLVGTSILAPGSGVSNWIAIGDRIAANTTTASGQNNVIVGQLSLYSATSAAQNSILGNSAGQSITTGSNNVLLGYQAGKSGTNNLTTGSNNILIGYNSEASSATVSNEIVIGNSSNTRFRIPGLNLDTDSATDGQVLGWNDSTGKFAWTTISGYSAPTIGSTSISSGSTVTSISGLTLKDTSSTTVSLDTATTVDTNALNAFTTAKYVVSIKQGTKIRSSEVIVQTDGTSVDMTEFGITETGGAISGVVVSATTSSTNAVLQVTVTDASSTNATVKIFKVLI